MTVERIVINLHQLATYRTLSCNVIICHVLWSVQVRDNQKAQTVPMYVIVTDDNLAREPEPGSLRSKTSSRRPQQIRAGRRSSVSAERYDPERDLAATAADGDEVPSAVVPKTPEQRRRLADAVRDILLFRSLDAEVMSDVIDAMFERRAAPEEYIIRQGDDGDNFYVIDSGVYDVIITTRKPGHGDDVVETSSRVLQFDGRGSFGELALMYNQPRAASVVAVTEGRLWAMGRHAFRRLVLQSAFRKRQMYDRLLRGVPMLGALDDYERATLADALRSQSFADGDRIVAEGDMLADGMYFIERGNARVTITKDGKETEVSRLATGDYFGEMALLENGVRTASVYAVSDQQQRATNDDSDSFKDGAVRVAFLERESFERLLGPCLDVLKRNTEAYQKSSP